MVHIKVVASFKQHNAFLCLN